VIRRRAASGVIADAAGGRQRANGVTKHGWKGCQLVRCSVQRPVAYPSVAWPATRVLLASADSGRFDKSHIAGHRSTPRALASCPRRLHHCRDLSEPEPFDFVTFFDFAKSDSTLFNDLVAELRATEEWKYVEREVDIRLVRIDE
jgi:hypothetical protein